MTMEVTIDLKVPAEINKRKIFVFVVFFGVGVTGRLFFIFAQGRWEEEQEFFACAMTALVHKEPEVHIGTCQFNCSEKYE